MSLSDVAGAFPRIALDAMGGDYAPDAPVQAANDACRAGVRVVVYGDEPALRRAGLDAGVSVVHAEQTLDPDLAPFDAVRAAPRSSVRLALEAHRAGEVGAVVSCGSTGPILLEAYRVLGLLPGVARPALAVTIPLPGDARLLLLDAGANVDCRPEHLVGFGVLGAAWAQAHGSGRPRVGLLSNGSEAQKGTATIRRAVAALAERGLAVVGQIEPHDALAGGCDVLVCDGLVGNVLLKSLEAAVDLLAGHAQALGAVGPIRERLLDRVSWPRLGAALLLGVDGVVAVGHGRSDAAAIVGAIQAAGRAVDARALAALRTALGPVHPSPPGG